MTQMAVGTPLRSVKDYDRLPIGTVVGPEGGANDFKKVQEGWYSEVYHNLNDVEDIAEDRLIVKVLPETPGLESLLQYQWRYRNNAYASAENAGVNRDVVDRVTVDLGITDDKFPLGRGVVVSCERDKSRLPADTLVAQGDPANLNSFGLWRMNHARAWMLLLGRSNGHNGHPVEVVTGDEVSWVSTPGTEEEQDRIATFKAQAWRAGWKVKLQHRWCESYESYMARVGLDESVLREAHYQGIRVGDMVRPEQACLLPAGSVLRWTSRQDTGTWSWFVRDDHVTNRAATRRLFGRRSDGAVASRNFATVMEVLWIADGGEMSCPIDNYAQVDGHLPPGTLLSCPDGAFVVAEDGRVVFNHRNVPAVGEWTLGQLTGPVSITRFGGSQ